MLEKIPISSWSILHTAVNTLAPGKYHFILNIPPEDLGLINNQMDQIRQLRDQLTISYLAVTPPEFVITLPY